MVKIILETCNRLHTYKNVFNSQAKNKLLKKCERFYNGMCILIHQF